MAIYKRDIASINLETGTIHRTFLNHSIGYKDQKADHFGIRVFRGGEPVDLTGVSVQGVFMPPQGDPIAITSGNIVSGNEAEVVLPQACYNYDGQFTLSIKLVDSNNSVTGTMRIVDGMVDNTHASGTVAPTGAVPTYQEILSTYDAMVAATAAANGAIAPLYANLTFPVKVGQYAIVDGALKRAIVDIATSEAYTAAHWTAAKIGPDLSDLKSAFDNTEKGKITDKTEQVTSWESGYLNSNGTVTDDSGSYRTSSFIFVPAGYICVFKSYASNSTYYYCKYNASKVFTGVGRQGLGTGPFILSTEYSSSDMYIRICTNSNQVATSAVEPTLYTHKDKRVEEAYFGDYAVFPEIASVGLLKSDGSVESSTAGIVTGLIKIPKGYYLDFNANDSISYYFYHEYTSAGVFKQAGIKGVGSTAVKNLKVFAYNEDRYIKIGTRTAYCGWSAIGAVLRKIDYGKVLNEDNISEGIGLVSSVSYLDGYLKASGFSESEDYVSTTQIPLAKGQTLYFEYGGSSSMNPLVECDAQGNILSGIYTGDSQYHRALYTADHDMYVRISSRDTNSTHKGWIAKVDFEKKWKVFFRDHFIKDEYLNGKKIVIIGDSLIYGNDLGNGATWCTILANETGATVYNYGINGSSVSNQGSGYNPMCVRYANISELSTADIIILEGGANDNNASALIGTESDDNTTFKGALKSLIDGIRSQNPKAALLFMTTYHRSNNTNSAGLKYIDYVTAMLEVCANNCVPCFNNYANSGIILLDTNIRAWADEGVSLGNTHNNHFSVEAYNWMYNKYKKFIELYIA